MSQAAKEYHFINYPPQKQPAGCTKVSGRVSPAEAVGFGGRRFLWRSLRMGCERNPAFTLSIWGAIFDPPTNLAPWHPQQPKDDRPREKTANLLSFPLAPSSIHPKSLICAVAKRHQFLPTEPLYSAAWPCIFERHIPLFDPHF